MLAYRPCAFSSLSGLENAHVMFYHPQTNVQVKSAADHSSCVFDELSLEDVNNCVSAFVMLVVGPNQSLITFLNASFVEMI